MNEAERTRLDHETTDALDMLPRIVNRLLWLDENLWHHPTGDVIPIQSTGHSDPVGETVAASADMRQHIRRALRLTFDACANLRGAQATLDRAELTIAGYDGTQAAADQAMGDSMRGRCNNCQQHAATRKGLCQPCNMWARRHGTPRPADQWQQEHHG